MLNFDPCLCSKGVWARKQHPSFSPNLFYFFQCILAHGFSRVDLNSNEFILFHISKIPEFFFPPGETSAGCYLSLSVTLNCMNSTEPIVTKKVKCGVCNIHHTFNKEIFTYLWYNRNYQLSKELFSSGLLSLINID